MLSFKSRHGRYLTFGRCRGQDGRLDGFFSKKLREVFNFVEDDTPARVNPGGFDLFAWNINRGRDHGLQRREN